MRVKQVEVQGLLGASDPVTFKLKEDLNILTGLNGSGKTTLLKLIWYILSGNITQALDEIVFRKATLETDSYIVSITKVSENTCRAEFEVDGVAESIQDETAEDDDGDSMVMRDARDTLSERLAPYGSSLFFPTFRRIEGGFAILKQRSPSSLIFNSSRGAKSELQDAVLAISRRLSSGRHTFVTSVSTVDVVEILLRKYTELSEKATHLQRAMSQEVIDRIKRFRTEENTAELASVPETADLVLDGIRSMIEAMDTDQKAIMAPMGAVQNLGARLFQHAGIRIGARFSFGDAANAVNSDLLSAGEKQMLSFICYNALTENSVIFIDEPELSLHVDWQRQLFPTLIGQGTSNQFIIATHSPFIYSKYPDKEVMMGTDRGDNE